MKILLMAAQDTNSFSVICLRDLFRVSRAESAALFAMRKAEAPQRLRNTAVDAIIPTIH